jgi:hypothetical protein
MNAIKTRESWTQIGAVWQVLRATFKVAEALR